MEIAEENNDAIAGACRCCLTIGPFHNLWDEYIVDGKSVVFGDLLSECFDIKIVRNQIINIQDQICEICTSNLYDADKFRRQVLNAQAQISEPLMLSNLGDNLDQQNEPSTTESPQMFDINIPSKVEEKKDDEDDLKTEMVEEFLDDFIKEEYLEDDFIMDEKYTDFYDVEPKMGPSDLDTKTEDNTVPDKARKKTKRKPKILIEEDTESELDLKSEEDSDEGFTLKKNSKRNIEKCVAAVTSKRLGIGDACKFYNCTKKAIKERIALDKITKIPIQKSKLIKGVRKNKVKKLGKEKNQQKPENRKPVKLRSIIHNLRKGYTNLQQTSETLNITEEELIEQIKTKYPRDFKNIMYLDKVTKTTNDISFDATDIKDDGDEELRVIKVIKKNFKPSKENIKNAIQAIKDGMTFTSAQRMYNITKTILDKFIKSNLPVTDNNIDIIMNQGRYRRHSVEFIKHCVNLVKEGKITKREASEWFKVSKKSIDYRIRHGFVEDQNTAKHSIQRNGVHVVEITSNIASPRLLLFNDQQRLKLEENVQTILNFTNATPFLMNTRKVLCAYCYKNLEKPEELRNHTITMHMDERLSKVPDMLRPALHKEIMRLDLHELKCTDCDKELNKIEDLYEHLNIQHNYLIEQSERNLIVPFVLHYFKAYCVICDQRLGDNAKLDNHMNKHYNNYVCHECGESFISVARLRKHKSVENQSKLEQKCGICGDVFIGVINYHKHLVSKHKLEFRSPCKYCPERFRDRYPRHLHMMEKHRDKVKDIVCECGRVFQWRTFYLQHFRKVHMNERNYPCCYCEKNFFSNYGVKKHMRTHVGEKAFICKICNIIFPLASILNEHWKKHEQDNDVDID